MIRIISQRAYAYEHSQALVNDLESARAQLAASAARIEDLTLQAERQRIARELHDTVTQGLAGLIMQLEATDARLGLSEPTVKTHLASIFGKLSVESRAAAAVAAIERGLVAGH